MVMVSEGDVSRLCVSKEPVRSKVTVSEDMGRKAVRREGMAAVRRTRREAPLLANIVCCVWPLQSLIQMAWCSFVSNYLPSNLIVTKSFV